MESIVYQNQEIKRWDVGPSTFLALPEKGARLLNWHINMSDGSVRDVIHWPEEPDCDSFAQTHGGIPVLFPFAGKCYDSEMRTVGDLVRISTLCPCTDLLANRILE